MLRPLAPDQAADLLEVIEDRAQVRSTIVTSQLPVAHWHEELGEATFADTTLANAILHGLLQDAHRIEFSGESLRRPDTVTRVGAGNATISEDDVRESTTPKSGRRSENRAAEMAVEAR